MVKAVLEALSNAHQHSWALLEVMEDLTSACVCARPPYAV